MAAFKTYFYLVAEAVIIVLLLLTSLGVGIFGYNKFRKLKHPKNDSALHGLHYAFLTFWMGSPLMIWISTGFNGIPWIAAWILMALIWMAGFLTLFKKQPEYKNDKFKNHAVHYLLSLKEGASKMGPTVVFIVFLVFAGFAFFITFFSYNFCVGLHPFRVTSEISRRMHGHSCPRGQVCNFILTVPEDLSTSIIVNFHTNDQPDQLDSQFPTSFAFYDTVSRRTDQSDPIVPIKDFVNQYKYMSVATNFLMPNIKEEQRYVHWADVSGLSPDTTYFITAGYQLNNTLVFYQERKFRTAPADGTPFRFMVGGDMGATKKGLRLSETAAEQEPLFVMVGGDVAYDSGFACCYRIWDEWFERWDKIFITPNNYTIPIITTIGNHESTGWRTTKDDVQFYTRYLPFQLGLQNVDPQDRPQYHKHLIGNDTVIIALDSDVVESIESQIPFLEATLNSTAQRRFKLGLYHIALYPCTKISLDDDITASAREHWSGIFDRYNLTVGFENHYHLYKRTKQLRGGQQSETGTLYIGDGSWGVDTVLKVYDYDYLAKAGKIQHVMKGTISPFSSKISIESYNSDKIVFDSWNRTLLY
ncbi:hypothetical protein CYY_008628 [Polysphondylium violaceum]|uniref:Purple acid phosphatase N-terminal domain-containing protein n=1 Tax=Polysphondylium violaceum TaxID=133409 RepID=A0A8J4PUV9_9MYCE|nr:hypothetical protein CYY_008628 [Polysphondylium violaceum]